MECECGHLHTSIFSDIITRKPVNFSECEVGEPGIIQVVSTIPESYPGHSLLTEDEGVILGEDDCPMPIWQLRLLRISLHRLSVVVLKPR